MFSSATQPPLRPQPPRRHNFVVSAITFEGFKLRSSNLTHALFIQISRTSLIIDIVVPSKMAASCHFVKTKIKKVAYRSVYRKWYTLESEFRTSKMSDRSEMASNAIESDFRTSKMAAETNKNSVSIWNGLNCYRKWISSKMVDRSEMARNAIESEFRTSKPRRPFCKKK